jgi:hypothetical protein
LSRFGETQELKMNKSFIGAMMCAAIAGVMAFASPAAAKTAKECRAEWTANKAANQAKGITEKAYVDKCKADTSAEKPKAAPAATTAKEKTPAAKEKTSPKMAAPAAGEKKTAKECEAEWRANKAANQAKGITEKAYVAECREGKAAATPAAAPAAPAQTKMAPPKAEPAQPKMAPAAQPAATKMAPPASAPAKSTARTEPAPATGQPSGANQFAAEGQAKAHCPTGTVVWANLDSKIFHFTGYADYGHTKKGAYMCEKDATAQGMRAAKNEKQP